MSKTGPKILVINIHSSRNAGDAALLEETIKSLLFLSPSEIVLAANNIDIDVSKFSDIENIRVVLSFTGHFVSANRRKVWRIDRMVWGILLSLIVLLWYRVTRRLPNWLPALWYDLFKAYANADLVISCPGNIFVTMGKVGLPFLVSAYTVAYALMMGKPLYVMPQSIGPLNRWWERVLVKLLYSRARLIFVREPISLRLAGEIGLPQAKLHLVPDLAFVYTSAPLEEAAELLKEVVGQLEGPLVGVTVINRLIRYIDNEVWEQYEKSIAYALSKFIDKYGGSIIFFPQVTGPTAKEDDRVASRRIVAKMGNPSSAIVIEKPLLPNILKAAYGLMDIFIATRMHSAIFAISMKVPTLLIGYLHKVMGLAQMLSLEEWVIDLRSVTENVLWERLEALWLNKDILREHLGNIMPLIEIKAGEVGQIIKRDFHEQ
jgi:colanic acid/amylovoran biosynthesis protein